MQIRYYGCSLPIIMFPLDCTSFFIFHLATLVVLPGDLVLFVLSSFVVFNITRNSFCVNIFFNFFYSFVFLSINCNYFTYFSDNSSCIYIILMTHREPSSTKIRTQSRRFRYSNALPVTSPGSVPPQPHTASRLPQSSKDTAAPEPEVPRQGL